MEDFSYRSPLRVSSLPEDAKPYVQDEQDFATLKVVKNTLESYINNLSHDFNAFEVLTGDEVTVAQDLIIQIKSKQEVHRLLSELVEILNSTISNIDLNIKQ
jgi:hypothetical protein